MMKADPYLIAVELIESKQPGSQNPSSIGNRTVGTAMLIFEIDSGLYHNGRRYLSPLNDYRQRSAVLMTNDIPSTGSLDSGPRRRWQSTPCLLPGVDVQPLAFEHRIDLEVLAVLCQTSAERKINVAEKITSNAHFQALEKSGNIMCFIYVKASGNTNLIKLCIRTDIKRTGYYFDLGKKKGRHVLYRRRSPRPLSSRLRTKKSKRIRMINSRRAPARPLPTITYQPSGPQIQYERSNVYFIFEINPRNIQGKLENVEIPDIGNH
ncbi:hypothetical protein EVAR_35922_1 [Eumeta japonica]|uniref:Uncharacterized protein n=1 Tax=Eumeta variegata TaxID=151549 RepID=A0A4C1W690_EUMVA|nr:hypothetical protein EVAR_35922_1 [Eumeta japonica]